MLPFSFPGDVVKPKIIKPSKRTRKTKEAFKSGASRLHPQYDRRSERTSFESVGHSVGAEWNG